MPAHADESMLAFYLRALGGPFLIVLLACAAIGFGATLVLVLRGKGTLASGALVFAALLPFFVGLCGAITNLIRVYFVIASSTVEPRFHELSPFGDAMVAGAFGTFLSFPGIMTAIVGVAIRTATEPQTTST